MVKDCRLLHVGEAGAQQCSCITAIADPLTVMPLMTLTFPSIFLRVACWD
jgi:hypothetical protein